MINDNKDLKYFMNCDKIALRIPAYKRTPGFHDYIWKYEILLRKCEYYKNWMGGGISKSFNHMIYKIYRFRKNKLGIKLNIFISENCFGPGLSIAHPGTIVVNSNTRVGSNCRIHEGVTIGTTNGSDSAPVIGNNCFIGSGAKIIGNIRVGNNVAIGANAVVIKDICDNVTVGGVPARVISNHTSELNCIIATELVAK